jgi:hypothetical protein
MRNSLILFLLLGVALSLSAQDDLLQLLAQEEEQQTYPMRTFDGTRVVNGHSVEPKRPGELEFLIMHRFGTLNSGGYNFFGLDNAFIRLGLEYGFGTHWSAGLGRSSFDKSYDAFMKYRLLQQSDRKPLTITALAGTAYKASPAAKDAPELQTQDRMAYTAQLLMARKLNQSLSVQLMPSVVHTNLVDQSTEINTLGALGAGARWKLTRSVALTGEYYYRPNAPSSSQFFNPLALGVDIETGGHVFQLHITNSYGMMERAVIGETFGDFFDGDIRFGFNISRNFQLKKPKARP